MTGEVWVRVGPCSAEYLKADRIPLDGRVYICAGEVILKNGLHLRAHFEIRTETFDFLYRNSVWVTLDGDLWFQIGERALRRALGLRKRDMFPYSWIPDRPLDHHVPGPHPMKWVGTEEGEP